MERERVMSGGSKGGEEDATSSEWRLPEMPREIGEVHRWMKEHLGLNVPSRRICPDHDAPMDYIAHAFKHKAPGALVWACRGGGKTMLAAALTVAESLSTPGLQTRILGGSLAQSSYMYDYVCSILRRPQFKDALGSLTRQRATFANGAAIEILPQSERTVRGVHVPRLRLDEVDEFKDGVFESSLYLPQSMNGIDARTDFLSTMHRPYGLMAELVDEHEKRGLTLFKWCLWEIIEACRDRRCDGCVLERDCGGKAKLADGYFSVDDAIARKRLVSDESWQSEMLSKRPSREGLFYKTWDESVHVPREAIGYDPMCELYRTFDWGVNGPTVCLWIQVDGDGRVRVIDELWQAGIAVSDMAEGVRRREEARGYGQVLQSYCDPTGLSYIMEFEKCGIPCQGRREDGGLANVRFEGFELVRRYLKCDEFGRPKMLVSPVCMNLRREFRGYRYPQTRPGFNPPEEPAKVDDHGMDALRYFFTSRFLPDDWRLV